MNDWLFLAERRTKEERVAIRIMNQDANEDGDKDGDNDAGISHLIVYSFDGRLVEELRQSWVLGDIFYLTI